MSSMPQVTDIKPQKKAGRYNVYLDGQFALGLDELTLVQKGVHLGQEIDKAELARLKGEGEQGKLYDKVLRFLAVRPRSEKEIRDYLRKKFSIFNFKFSNEEKTIEEFLERLRASGLVDDEKFARWWVEQRQGGRKPKGQRIIGMELRQKGVAREIIETVLPRMAEAAEQELAEKAAAKKMRLYRRYPPPAFRQKMAQYLLRQGFTWPVVKEVLQKRLSNDFG